MSQIPIGWSIEGFEETPEKQQVSMIDGINQSPAPHFLPKGHYWRQVKIVQSIYQVHYKQTVARLVGAWAKDSQLSMFNITTNGQMRSDLK